MGKEIEEYVRGIVNAYHRLMDDYVHSPKTRHAFHASHGFVHLVYFAGVWIEGHGVYAIAGGVLLVMGILSYFVEGGH